MSGSSHPAATPAAAAAAPSTAPKPAGAVRKLSHKEQRELQQLPGRIEALEAEQRAIGERLASAALYIDEPQRVVELQARYAQIDDELTHALQRWEELESR